MKAHDKLVERRRYIRLKTPIPIIYTITDTGNICRAVTKDISAEGLRFETRDKDLKESTIVEIKLELYGANNPVHAKGTVVWKKKLSLEDRAPYDVGIELTEVEEDNKNTFLKFLCELIYNIPKESEDVP